MDLLMRDKAVEKDNKKYLNKKKRKVMLLDPYCKENTSRPIDRKICRNNCKQWKNNKCQRGY